MGPTASGKSDVAIKLARKFNGEIISADSRQIYKGMDLGTGKVQGQLLASSFQLFGKTITRKLFISEGIPHHLIDVVEPNEDFNISHFKKMANKAIEEILSKGKLPIICGGTGFWIQAITENMNLPEVPPNEKLRQKLELKTSEELFEQLKKLDPERASDIDNQNKFRLIRALEIIETLGKVPSKLSVIDQQSSKYNFLQIAISVPKEVLHEKIRNRLESRLEEGMIEEVKKLNENGVSWERLEKFGLEYRWLARFLQNKISKEEMQEKLYFDIIHYAKRQMTWLKRNKEIVWKNDYQDIENEVIEFLK